MATGDRRLTRTLVVDGSPVDRVEVADTFWKRFRGLMLRNKFPAGLLLTPENSVHGMWMLQEIEIASIDEDGTVLAVQILRPWRVSTRVPGTRSILEAPPGNFTRWGLKVGSHIETSAR